MIMSIHLFTRFKYQLITLVSHILFLYYSYVFGIWFLIISIGLSWIVSNLVHSLYMHRIYTHRHFYVSKNVHNLGMFLFGLLNLGSPAVYVATHIRHHAYSGTDKDPHDPYVTGFVRVLFSLWDHRFAPDRKILSRLLKDPTAGFFHRHHLTIASLSAIFTPSLVVVGFWLSKLVIMVTHIRSVGQGSNKGSDTSRNVWWLKPILWGEELHNNHHNHASTANHNIAGNLKEFDPLFYIGKHILST